MKRLLDRAVALDLVVYTPAEWLALYRMGSPFVEEVLRTGKVVYMRDPAVAWLRDVEDELAIATLLVTHQMFRGARPLGTPDRIISLGILARCARQTSGRATFMNAGVDVAARTMASSSDETGHVH